MKSYDIRNISNWYINRTKDSLDGNHGLGSLNNFLIVLRYYSIKDLGYPLYGEPLHVHNNLPVVDKIILFYEDQARYLKDCIDCGDESLIDRDVEFLEKIYLKVSKIRPLKIKDLFSSEITPWYNKDSIKKTIIDDDVFVKFCDDNLIHLIDKSIN